MKLFNATYYHGSGKTFDKFDFNFIGSGEGAQVHGWGIYLAKKKSTAKHYKDWNIYNNTAERATVYLNYKDGKSVKYQDSYRGIVKQYGEFDESIPDDAVAKNLMEFYKEHREYDTIKQPFTELDGFKYNTNYEVWFDVLDKLESVFGYVITVDESMIATVKVNKGNYINEDDIISEDNKNDVYQTFVDIIRMAFDVSESEALEHIRDFSNGDTSVKTIYKYCADSIGAEEVSMQLLHNGIDGIKYVGGNDGECIVLFNLDKCEIIAQE